MKVTQSNKLIGEYNRQFFGIIENEDGSITNGQYVVSETDTSGIVTTGKTLEEKFEAGDNSFVDNYVGGLISRISRIVYVARAIEGTPLDMVRTDEQWGEIVEKVRFAMGDVQEDDSWNLVDGEDYPQDTYYPPSVSVKFFDGLAAFVYPVSKTREQILSAFTGEGELLSFMNSLSVSVENAMLNYLAGLEIATLNTFMASLLASDNATQRVVHLLTEYAAAYPNAPALTAETAIVDKDFLVWMCARIDLDVKDMRISGTFYNGTDKYPTFTPDSMKSFVLLSTISTYLDNIAKATIYNSAFVKLPRYKELPCWQGRKENNDSVSFKAKSTVNVKNTQALKGVENSTINMPYVIGCMYDYDAMGINLYKRSIDITPYNARGRFWTEYNRGQGRYFIDTSENGVVYVLD